MNSKMDLIIYLSNVNIKTNNFENFQDHAQFASLIEMKNASS